jgi:hypothetical protein
VGHEVNASADGNTELSEWEEEGGKVIGKDCGNGGASDATPGSSDADGAEFGKVIRIFMKCKDAAGGEQGCDLWWDVVIRNKSDNGQEGLEVGGVTS